jgi:hypothetical protein
MRVKLNTASTLSVVQSIKNSMSKAKKNKRRELLSAFFKCDVLDKVKGQHLSLSSMDVEKATKGLIIIFCN